MRALFEGGADTRPEPLAEVVINFNRRTYRFQCPEAEAPRLEQLAGYLKEKLDALVVEHGGIGDDRLILMAALTLADELFDARADVDELLGENASPGSALRA